MVGVVFRETLRRGWRGMLGWGIGFALIALVQAAVLADVDALKQFAELVASMPPFIMQMLGTSDAAFLGTPEGYLAGRFFNVAVVFFAIYGVSAGLNVTAVEEDRGIMDSQLSTPLARWQLILGKMLAYALMLLGIVLITFAGVAIGLLLTPVAAEFDFGRLFEVTMGLYMPGLVVMAFTAMVAGLVSSRTTVSAVAYAFVIVSYFINFIGGSASESIAAVIGGVSFFNYYNAGDIMKNGMVWSSVGLLVSASVLLVGLGMFAFQRRDISA